MDCSKYGVKYFPIPENEIWRVNVLKELIDLKESHFVSGFSNEDLFYIVNNVACN